MFSDVSNVFLILKRQSVILTILPEKEEVFYRQLGHTSAGMCNVAGFRSAVVGVVTPGFGSCLDNDLFSCLSALGHTKHLQTTSRLPWLVAGYFCSC